MKNIIKNLPKDQGHDKSVMKVGFITYNNTVHFYNIKSSLAQPQMMVVGDVQVSSADKIFQSSFEVKPVFFLISGNVYAAFRWLFM